MFEAIRKKTGPRSFLEITAEKANAAMVAGDIEKALRCKTILAKAAKAETKPRTSAQQRRDNKERLSTRARQDVQDRKRHAAIKEKADKDRKRKLAALRTAAEKDPELRGRLEAMGIKFTFDFEKRLDDLAVRFEKTHNMTEAESTVTVAELLPELAEEVLKTHQNEVDPWPRVDLKKKVEIEARADARIKKGVDPYDSITADEFSEYQTSAMGFDSIA